MTCKVRSSMPNKIRRTRVINAVLTNISIYHRSTIRWYQIALLLMELIIRSDIHPGRVHHPHRHVGRMLLDNINCNNQYGQCQTVTISLYPHLSKMGLTRSELIDSWSRTPKFDIASNCPYRYSIRQQ